MKHLRIFIYFLLLAVIVSCGQNKKLDLALSYSGDNKEELKKVLDHYSEGKGKDSLKLAAAEFLIQNMPAHGSVIFKDMDRYIDNTDQIYKDKSLAFRKVLYTVPKYFTRSERINDIHFINSDFLINHIDFWFTVWKTSPWLKYLSFDSFLNYLLPYKAENEYFDTIDYDRIRKNIDSLTDMCEYYEWLRHLSLNHYELHEIYKIPEEEELIGNEVELAYPYNERFKFNCEQDALYYYFHFKSYGIPCALDFVPYWGHINGGHYWCAVVDDVFEYNTMGWYKNTLTPKVYRITYKNNPVIEDKKNYVPELFRNPLIEDVTKSYISTVDIPFKINKKIKYSGKYAYLAVFNSKDLREIAYSRVKRRKALFSDMGKMVVYYPVFYEGNTRKFLGYPFYIDPNDNINYFVPNENLPEKHRLTRKDRTDGIKMFWSLNMLGSSIQASDDPDFNRYEVIHVFNSHNPDLNGIKITLENPRNYRYWRYAVKKAADISEFGLFDVDGRIEPLGVISFPESSEIKNVTDDDILTYVHINENITIDIGPDRSVVSFAISPRSDDNGIVEGERYELFYYNENGWVSLGEKTGTGSQYLEYDNMPKGAVFWLRNYTKGVEERPFTIDEYGGQRFW